MVKVYKNEALAAVHKMMDGFHQSGAIGEQTMREFDNGCLTGVEALTQQEIRADRHPTTRLSTGGNARDAGQ